MRCEKFIWPRPTPSFPNSLLLFLIYNLSWREKDEKKLVIPASSQATTEFVRYLYGFELDKKNGLETVKELIQIAGIYDDKVQDAAVDDLEKHLTVENIFEIYHYFKENNASKALEKCYQFIVENFSKKDLVESKALDNHPEIGVEFLKRKKCFRCIMHDLEECSCL